MTNVAEFGTDTLIRVMTETEITMGPNIGDTTGKREDRFTLRHDPDEWASLDAVAKSLGYRSRNAYVSHFIEWALHKPGIKAPKRPHTQGTQPADS